MPIGGAIFVGKEFVHRGFGLQFSWNRTQEYVLFDSNPLPTPNLLLNGLAQLTEIAHQSPRARSAPTNLSKSVSMPSKDGDESVEGLRW